MLFKVVLTNKIKKTAIIFLIWTVAGLFYSSHSYYYRLEIGQNVEWLNMFTRDAPYFILWSLFTPVALFVSRKFKFSRNNWGRLFWIHLLFMIMISFTHAIIINTYRLILTSGLWSDQAFQRIYINSIANVDYGMLVYCVMLLIINVIDYYGRFQKERSQNAELEVALTQAQLNALKMQLQPHFLFNTLNSISVLIKENPQQAGEMIGHLSNLLRKVLKNAKDQFNTLKKEVDFITQYLAIEQVRFGERLKVKIDIPLDLETIEVPSLILQPLVENAIRHGIAKKSGDGIISLSALKEDDKLCLQVFDNGKGFDMKKPDSQFGIGLQITRDRLQSLYEQNYKLELTHPTNGGTQFVLKIPIPLEPYK